MIKLIALDADDTLWHNEHMFLETRDRFRELLSEYHSDDWVDERLNSTELRNLKHFGYGIKSFVLSMIETAVELTEGRIRGNQVMEIVGFAKDMSNSPVRLLDHVEDTVRQLASRHQLVVITKGDLFDQESKLARSGLGDYFSGFEVVTEKNCATYESVVERTCGDPSAFLMIGNSIKSDVIPVVEMGGNAIHIPYHTMWEHETVSEDEANKYSFLTAASIAEVPTLVEELSLRN